MKSVLISIKPKWCELIASGKKTTEARKTRPKCDTPFKCYIYCTKNAKELIKGDMTTTIDFVAKNNGKVIGEFVCRNMTCIQADIDSQGEKHLYNTAFIENRMCLTDEKLFNYIYDGKRNTGWAWGISDLVIYDEPKELADFKKINRECWYADLGFSKRDCPECKNAECFMQRPPQSWCYCEEEEE